MATTLPFRAADLWERRVYEASGDPIGVVEAIATSRQGALRKVGVGVPRNRLRFLRVSDLRLEDDHLVLAHRRERRGGSAPG